MKALDGCSDRVNLASADNPGEIITALLKAAVLLRVQFADFLDRFEMSEGRYSVLTVLERAGSVGVSQAEVAEQLMHSESNVSSLIDRLQHDGLVDRRWSDTDRRKRVLLITPAGQVMVDQIEAARRGWAEGVLSGVTANARRDLVALLRQLPARPVVSSVRQVPRRMNKIHAATDPDAEWRGGTSAGDIELASPQSALERMLSTLGMAGRFAEDER